MTRKRILYCCLALAFVSAVGVFAERAMAIPEPGFLLIFTVDPETGDRVGNVRITVRQVQGNYPFQSLRTTTDDFGRLYLSVPEGTYRVRAAGYHGPPINVFVPSGGEIYLAIPVNG